MGYIYKILPEVTRFVIAKKRQFPDMSCRKLASEASEKFRIKVSKSSVNNIIKKENLSSFVGRRPKIMLNAEKALEHGGAFLLRGIDHFLGISKTAADVLLEIMPVPYKIKRVDAENTLCCFLLYKSLFDVTFDTSILYDNIEIWSLVGRRPTKRAYNLIVQLLNESQLFVDHLVNELKQRLQGVSGFRFNLSDQSRFFVDAQKQGIWREPITNKNFYSTYYNSNCYINRVSEHDDPLLIFNIVGTSIHSSEVIDLIAGFNADDAMRKLSSIELFGTENKALKLKFIPGSRKRFFLAGFWPWQLETMYELERKPAQSLLTWSQLNLQYYYQIEEVNFIQRDTLHIVKLIAILLKTSPLGIVKMGILSNISRKNITRYLTINNLYHWIYPEENLRLFTQLNDTQSDTESFFDWFARFDFAGTEKISLNKTLEMLSQIIFSFFQNELIPKKCRQWSRFKIKDVFLRQRANAVYTKNLTVCNLFVNNMLDNREHFNYICQRINNLGITDARGLMWFQVKTE